MPTNDLVRAQLTARLAELEAEKADREERYPTGATLANPSYRKLIESIAHIEATLHPNDEWEGERKARAARYAASADLLASLLKLHAQLRATSAYEDALAGEDSGLLADMAEAEKVIVAAGGAIPPDPDRGEGRANAFQAANCEATARAAGWDSGGGYIYDAKVFGSWKEAVSWAGAEDSGDEEAESSVIYGSWAECCDSEGLL